MSTKSLEPAPEICGCRTAKIYFTYGLLVLMECSDQIYFESCYGKNNLLCDGASGKWKRACFGICDNKQSLQAVCVWCFYLFNCYINHIRLIHSLHWF